MLDQYSGATRVVFILGDPIAQVKAPHGLTREFERRGHDAIVVPLQLAPGDVDAGIVAITRAKNVHGLIATIPHKFALAARCATLSERSKFLGVVNVARRNADGSWHGDMLDGEGFVISGTVTTSPTKAAGARREMSTGSGSSGFMPSGVALTTMPASLVAARQKGCRIQTGVEMFGGNLGLMADFFAAAMGCDTSAQ